MNAPLVIELAKSPDACARSRRRDVAEARITALYRGSSPALPIPAELQAALAFLTPDDSAAG